MINPHVTTFLFRCLLESRVQRCQEIIRAVQTAGKGGRGAQFAWYWFSSTKPFVHV